MIIVTMVEADLNETEAVSMMNTTGDTVFNVIWKSIRSLRISLTLLMYIALEF